MRLILSNGQVQQARSLLEQNGWLIDNIGRAYPPTFPPDYPHDTQCTGKPLNAIYLRTQLYFVNEEEAAIARLHSSVLELFANNGIEVGKKSRLLPIS